MSNAVMYGLYVAAANIILSLILHFTGAWKGDLGQYVGIIYYVFLAIGLVMAIKDRRDNENGGTIRFGQAFSTGFTVVIVAAVCSAIYFYVYAAMINPELTEHIKQQMEAGMAEKKAQMTEEQFEQTMKYSTMMATPGMMALWQFLGTLIVGSIITAIAGAILKKNPEPQVMA
jgi:hypothetical protein